MRDRARILADLRAALALVPASRVVPLHVLAAHLGLSRPAALRLITGLDDAERQGLPWHRVVAEGGAIGRHQRAHVQMRLLQADGVPVSPAGIIDGFRERAVLQLDGGASPLAASPDPTVKPSRSRGMKDRP